MPDVFVEDGSGGELGDFGLLGLGTEAIAFPTRDFGLFFAFTSPPLSRVSGTINTVLNTHNLPQNLYGVQQNMSR
jgi:hypothetical protein